jgi:lariat debranching enzyme
METAGPAAAGAAEGAETINYIDVGGSNAAGVSADGASVASAPLVCDDSAAPSSVQHHEGSYQQQQQQQQPASSTMASQLDQLVIAVEGCCHGELDTIYRTIAQRESRGGFKVDLLLICGDFQSIRVPDDMMYMAVPPKYRKMNSFQDYYTGKKVAPVMTIFVGGNHEASNVLHGLYHGGFVAPNIYFLGFAGVVNFGGVRIGGLSGIFNEHHYRRGHYEAPPYSEDTMRSIYHLRELEVYRMCQVRYSPVDIMLSHDWPQGIWNYGDARGLLRVKPYFKEDMRTGKLGSPPLMHILRTLQPDYWFAAHLHCKFEAAVAHLTGAAASSADSGETAGVAAVEDNSQKRRATGKTTHFLALDKVIRGRYVNVITVGNIIV